MFTLKSEENQHAAGDRNYTPEPSPYGDRNRVNCTYCRKVFKSHNYLKVHEKWHRGELEYPCNVCGRAFRYPSELKKHITIHSGELPYKCELCGKSFGRGQLLKEHMQVQHNASVDRMNMRGLSRPPPFKRGAVREIIQPKIESNWEKDLLMNISPNIETNWERQLLRNSSSKIETSWERDLLRNSSSKNETSWERNSSSKKETSWEKDLFRNISPSEIIERQDLMQNYASAMDVDNNDLAKANRQEITDAFSQLTKDFGISISFPEPVNSSGLQKGSYADESILGLNEEFIDIKSLNLAQITSEGDDSVTDSAMDDWKDEDSLPAGWKINSEDQFMSPRGRTFGSRRAVKEFLERNKGTDIEMHEEECGEGPGAPRHEASKEKCEKCLLIKEYERKIALLQHEH